MSEHHVSMQRQAALVRLIPLHRNANQPAHTLNGVLSILGSGDGADLILASSRVDASHAVVVCLGRAAYIADLGASGGTTLNGRRLRWARLAKGDEIGIGPFRFGVEIEEPCGSGVSEEPVFSLRNEQTIGLVTSIDPMLLIGSDAGCDVVLRHQGVLPRHALIVWTAEGPVVRDLQRRENTRLNGRRINFGRLVNGDSVGIGPFELVFEAPIITPQGTPTSIPSRASGHASSPRFDASMFVAGRLTSDQVARVEDLMFEAAKISEEPADKLRMAPETDVAQVADSQASRDELSLEELMMESVEKASMPTAPVATEPAKTNGQGGRQMVSTKPATPEIHEGQNGKIEQRYADLRRRVAAAQNALDERAKKLREGLNVERQQLKACRAELQRRAEELLRAAQTGQALTPAGSDNPVIASLLPGIGGSAPKSSSWRSGVTAFPRSKSESRSTDRPSAAESAMPSGFRAATPAQDPATPDGLPPVTPGSGRGSADSMGLWERTHELTLLVQTGRDEIEQADRRLAMLRLDIQRLRNLVSRTRERYNVQGSELEARFAALEKDQQTLRDEREQLMARIRELNTKDVQLQTRVKAAETSREELAREAERLTKAQEVLDERQRALRVSVEEERQMLKARQEMLRRKTAELAQATRDRRQLVEEQMADQEVLLGRREAEIKARRMALEESSRAELQKTTAELEEILAIGIGQLDAELEARQADLEAHAKAMFEDSEAVVASAEPDFAGVAETPGCQDGFTSPAASEHAATESGPADTAMPSSGTEKAAGRLEILVREVDALRSALAEMESRSEYSPRSNDVEDAEERHALQMDPPARILSATAVARLRRQNATLRGAPTSRSQPGDRTYRLQPIEGSNETNEIAEEPAQVRP